MIGPTPDLSRRAARAMNSRMFSYFDFDKRLAFVKAVSQVKNFDDLPQEWQNLVIRSEDKSIQNFDYDDPINFLQKSERQDNPDFSRASHGPAWRAPSQSQLSLETKLATAIRTFIKAIKVAKDGVVMPNEAERTKLLHTITDILESATDEGKRIATGKDDRGLISAFKNLAGCAVSIVGGIISQLREKVQSFVDQASDDGLHNPYANIAESIGEWAKDYADTVAITEVTAAVEEAVLDELTEQGTAMISVVTSPGACKVCLENEAASPLPIGAVFPSGHRCSPFHCNCRCNMVKSVTTS